MSKFFTGSKASLSVVPILAGCGTAGSAWIAEPFPPDAWQGTLEEERSQAMERSPEAKRNAARVRVIAAPRADAAPGAVTDPPPEPAGRSLGSFRNTYYDFPSEAEFDGAKVAIKNARCETISEVPRGFFESLCVQGSGTLKSGATVSFAKRDCGCAEICPKTEQRICFDALDPKAFPWGRGAMGRAITPLLTVAVDSNVIPLGTPLYIPELDGLPRDASEKSTHDGCFLAQDRGIRVKGKHVDVFTGDSATTLLWNHLVPSNRGVTVILDTPRCHRSDTKQ